MIDKQQLSQNEIIQKLRREVDQLVIKLDVHMELVAVERAQCDLRHRRQVIHIATLERMVRNAGMRVPLMPTEREIAQEDAGMTPA